MNRLLSRWLQTYRCVDCRCYLMRSGKLTGVHFMISPEGRLVCEKCYRAKVSEPA